jgi:predicted site-specific integrase-resolvase
MTATTDGRMTPSQAAERLEVTSKMVRRWIGSGRLVASSTSLGDRIDVDSVERMRAERIADGKITES